VSKQKEGRGKAAVTTLPVGIAADRFSPKEILQLEDRIVKKFSEDFLKMKISDFLKLKLQLLPASELSKFLGTTKEREDLIKPFVKELVKEELNNPDLLKLIQ